MGCCSGDREKGPIKEESKWDYITLDDFKSNSCLTPFSYVWIWIFVFIGIGVIAVDTFTAINLIVFNRWSSQVRPWVPFRISKWIFAGCIIFSFVLLAYEIQRAIRVMKRGGIADSYMDPYAAEWQCVRQGRGRGWKRFLVFAALTKSRKGVDYIALFVYFQFKTSVRILAAEGPRQVLNAMTLYSVFRLNLLPDGRNAPKDGHNGIQQFWSNIQVLADKDYKQAVILFSMLFTFVIWFFCALFLLIAAILYILFLWHHIPSADGSLSKYCRRKIETRLAGIVSKKTRKALEKAAAKAKKEERLALKRGETFAKPTLPGIDVDDDASSITALSRTDTSFSKPGLARTATFDSEAPTLPDVEASPISAGPHGLSRPAPSRGGTGSSFSSNAPLLSNSGAMGYTDQSPGYSNNGGDYFTSHMDRPGPPSRSYTGTTQRSGPPGYGPQSGRGSPSPYGPLNGGGPMSRPLGRPPTAQSRGGPTPGPFGPSGLRRVDTGDSSMTGGGGSSSSFGRQTPGNAAPSPISPYNDPAPSARRNSPPERFGPSYEMGSVRTSPPGGSPMGGGARGPTDPYGRAPSRQGSGPSPGGAYRPPFAPPPQQQRSNSNMILDRSATASPGAMSTAGGGSSISGMSSSSNYVAFNPSVHAASAPPSRGTPAPSQQQHSFAPPPPSQPTRNFSGPMGGPPPPQALQRSFTSPDGVNGDDGMMPRGMRDPVMGGRSATAGPMPGGMF